jgi:hypothetical protein
LTETATDARVSSIIRRTSLIIEKSGIRVAEYLTELPPRDVLVGKLHKAIDHARKQFENQIEGNATE